jgi:RNA 2',3'-cyclic 3'-phosphodiesterase
MSETTRTFIAIGIPRPMGREIAGLQTVLAPEITGCRWAESSPFHITLAFLGDVLNSDLAQLNESINAATDSIGPFEVALEGLGAFPSVARPRVIWVGVGGPNMKPLLDLQEAVVDAIAEIGFRPDDLKFHPHVTIGRIKPGRHGHCNLTRLVERYRGWSTESFAVEEVTTFSSTLGSGGPIYTPIGHAPLKSKK